MSEPVKVRAHNQAQCKDCSLAPLCLPLSLNLEDMDALEEIVKRDRLIAEDAAVNAWVTQYPDTDVQQLRALVRQARKDAPAPTDARVAEATGQAARQGRAYRELFQLVRDALTRAEASTPQVQAIDAEDAGYTDDSRAG